MTNSSTKSVLVIRESKAVQTHVHNLVTAASMYLRCIEGLKIWAQLFKANDIVS